MSALRGHSQQINPGRSYPPGASVTGSGVNFSVYSKSASGLELLLFESAEDATPCRVIPFEPTSAHRTFHYWHLHVPNLKPGQIYGFRARGPFDPQQGHRFDQDKLLLDPYGRAVSVPSGFDRKAGEAPGSNCSSAMKSVVACEQSYDWEGDEPLRHPFSQTVIYELHVAGFTRNPNSGLPPELRGTYRGLIEKIPYLRELGITAVELSPVFQFDPQEAAPGLTNYWGYNPVSFFAPHGAYAATRDPLLVLDEFRDMVKALHRAGIEVILDVVYNHTAEGNEDGPTFCFKGLENSAYYILGGSGEYANYSGTGNTLNASHSVVRRMIIDSLRYWVREMHIDGFRFDLASILSRDGDGTPLLSPPILWDIETDPVLSGTKLIAEAWDAGGLYQVGRFFGDHWREWNGQFRDDVRAFLKGDPGYASRFAHRFIGSPDIYGHRSRTQDFSINFVTCHDGFTLNDLVSYNQKHNLANGEENRDGHNDNRSWNCGKEGPSNDPAIEALRVRQIKNFLTINLLSLGTPMLLMGDEVRRTQQGNNNAYCQDNELSWFDWQLVDQNAEIFRFAKRLLEFRNNSTPVDREHTPLDQLIARADLNWHGVRLGYPDWSPDSHSIALSASGALFDFYVIFNSFWDPLEFELPSRSDSQGTWMRIIDTSLPSPHDIAQTDSATPVQQSSYRAESRSVVVFFGQSAPESARNQ